MKNLKYSSVIPAFAAVILSVFLFTACEKDTAVNPQSNKGDIIEKFKRLKFQTVTKTKGNSSGSYASPGDGNANFVTPNSSGPSFSSVDAGSNNQFTDPMSSANTFAVNGNFGFGGGSFTLNGEKIDIAVGFCGTDIFGELGLSEEELDEVDIFIGVAGDFDIESNSEGEIEYLVYAISYNGGTELSNLDEIDENNMDGLAFVMIMEFNENNFKAYLSTGGSIAFSDTYMTLSNVSLVDEEGMDAGSMDAAFECVNYEFEETASPR